MASVLTSLLSVTGIIGSCSAVTIPLTLSTIQTSSGGANKNVGLKNSGVISPTLKRRKREISTTLRLSFEDLWKEITYKWKEKQSQSSQEETNLSWKEQLQEILMGSESSSNKTWSIKSQDWKNCGSATKGKITNCGYIYLNGQDFDYKLRVNYEYWGTSKEDEWRIYVVRDNGEIINYYDFDSWKDGNRIDFEKLETSVDKSDYGWELVPTLSLKKKVNSGVNQ